VAGGVPVGAMNSYVVDIAMTYLRNHREHAMRAQPVSLRALLPTPSPARGATRHVTRCIGSYEGGAEASR
jgi:hypothetical protein